jgi:hypothetical protein
MVVPRESYGKISTEKVSETGSSFSEIKIRFYPGSI